MIVALFVPFEWDLLLPGVFLFFVPLFSIWSSGVSYVGPIVEFLPYVFMTTGLVLVCSIVLAVHALRARDARHMLIAACVYTCQAGFFLEGLEIVFVAPISPRSLHPAALLFLGGLAPLWLLLHRVRWGASVEGSQADRWARRWLVPIILVLAFSAGLGFGLASMWMSERYGEYYLVANALWIFSLAYSAIITLAWVLVIPKGIPLSPERAPRAPPA